MAGGFKSNDCVLSAARRRGHSPFTRRSASYCWSLWRRRPPRSNHSVRGARGAAAGAGSATMSGEGAAEDAPEQTAAVHAASFKLRFAAQREPGRSNVSLVRPAGLPATVTDKWWHAARAEPPAALVAAALGRIERAYGCGPRDRLAAPQLASHEYGWWSERTVPQDPRLQHHIRDSCWLKDRLRVLAADNQLKEH